MRFEGRRHASGNWLFDRFAPTSIGHFDRSLPTYACALAAPALIFSSLFFEWIDPDFGARSFFNLVEEQRGALVAPIDFVFSLGPADVSWIARAAVGSIYVGLLLASIAPQALYRAPREQDAIRSRTDIAPARSAWPLTLGTLAFLVATVAVSGLSFPHQAVGFWLFIGGSVAWWLAMRNIQAAVRRLNRAVPHRPGLGFPSDVTERTIA
jgi:hypothetical protein